MESAGKRLRTRTDIGKDIERCLDDLKITHAELAEMLNVSDKTVDRMIGGKGPTTKYASALASIHVCFKCDDKFKQITELIEGVKSA